MPFRTAKAFEHVDKLAYEIGPRVPGSRGEALSADYIEGQLKSMGLEVRRQTFGFTDSLARARVFSVVLAAIFPACAALPLPASAILWLASLALALAAPFPRRSGVNIIARVPGRGPPVALSAHHDSAARFRIRKKLFIASICAATIAVGARAFYAHSILLWPPCAILLAANAAHMLKPPELSPGANDNASGVAVLLEVARCLRELPNPPETIFLFTGGEEAGLQGMKHAVKTLPDGVPLLNVDTVGFGGQAFFVEGNGLRKKLRTSDELNRRLEEAAAKLSIEIHPWWFARARHDHIPALLTGHPATTLTFDAPDHPVDRKAAERGLKNAWKRSYKWLHTAQDLPDKLDPATLETAGNLVLEFLGARQAPPDLSGQEENKNGAGG